MVLQPSEQGIDVPIVPSGLHVTRLPPWHSTVLGLQALH
jgi:hypothetical protein